ncbi:site-2 protease family protein [Thermogladius sp. 4427co]|uniref:site-2 protease family protein n=1 Tax=Thermogladius sp. 4427co TaxID=3450718 RepID=UPI003F7AEAEC
MSWFVELDEPLALIIGGLAVAVAFGGSCLLGGNIGCFTVLSLASILAVIPHEIAHRNTARRMGCWSRYVLSPIGLLVTVLTSLPFIPFKFIMPGFTLISPYTYDPLELKKVEGLTSLSGPLYNIVVAVASTIALSTLRTPLPVSQTLYAIAYVNSWVALFNLLPIPPLDGYKVLKWKPVIYIAAFAASLLNYAYLYIF